MKNTFFAAIMAAVFAVWILSGCNSTDAVKENEGNPVAQQTTSKPAAPQNVPKEPASGNKETKTPAEKWKSNPHIWEKVSDYKLDTEEPEPYWYLVHMMNSMTDKELENAAVPFKRDQYEKMLANPSNYREKVIEISGRLWDLHPRILDCQTMIELTGVKQVWAAVIVNLDYNVFQVYLTERRPEVTGPLRWGTDGSYVKCKAAFMKAHLYTNLNGGRQKCLIFVGKYLEPSAAPEKIPEDEEGD